VPFATVDDRSVPLVPKVSAATLVTVPEPLLLKVVQSVLDKYPSTLPVAFAMLNSWSCATARNNRCSSSYACDCSLLGLKQSLC